MRNLLLKNIFFMSLLLGANQVVAQDAESTPTQSEISTQERRNYPGGRDDSDLTVQPLRRIAAEGPATLEERYENQPSPTPADTEAAE